MSVAVAITVTLPSAACTSSTIVVTGTDVALALGPEVKRLVQNAVDQYVKKELQGVATVSASVT